MGIDRRLPPLPEEEPNPEDASEDCNDNEFNDDFDRRIEAFMPIFDAIVAILPQLMIIFPKIMLKQSVLSMP
jgi:hypothetical protein